MTAVPMSAPRLSIRRKLLASVISAAVVALAVQVATVLALSVAYQFASGIVEQASAITVTATLIFFVLQFLLALVGGYTSWYLALASGLVGGALAAVTASSLTLTSALTSDIIGLLFGSLLTSNLPFFVASIITAVTLGRLVWNRATAFRARTSVVGKNVALVRVPANNLAEGQVTHIDRVLVDTDLAEEQWDAYVTALLENGWSTNEVEAAPELADSVFVEDAIVIFGDLAVIARSGSEARRGEAAAVEATVSELGLDIERIEAPGTLDGGDVLKVGSTVYVGRGGRTNAEGIRQLRVILAGLGYSIVAVPTTKVLHLKSAVTALPDGTVIGYPPLVDDIAVFDRFLAVPEESGAHVVVLSEDTVLMAASAPQSAALIEDLGYTVVLVDISEFEKLEGCVTCLSVRIR